MAELRQVAPEIWETARPLRVAGMELGHRMTVVRLRGGGGLWVHSPVEWTAALGAELGELGVVRHVVAPSAVHDLYLDGWREHCRTAFFWAAPGLRARLPGFPFTAELSDAPHPEWAELLDQVVLGGIPSLNEVVFLHVPSRSLIVADLVFNLEAGGGTLSTLLLRLNGALGRVTPSRLFRSAIRDKAALATSLRRIFEWDFDRILVGHGAVVERSGKHVLAAAYGWLPGAFPEGRPGEISG